MDKKESTVWDGLSERLPAILAVLGALAVAGRAIYFFFVGRFRQAVLSIANNQSVAETVPSLAGDIEKGKMLLESLADARGVLVRSATVRALDGRT